MRKSFHLLIWLLVFLAFLPGGAYAGSIDWQIIWQENGNLQEEVRISGRTVLPRDSNWERSQEGSQQILRREVNSWSSYKQLEDRLPLEARQSNYILYKQTEVEISIPEAEGLFQQLNGLNGFNLTIKVPGIISGSSADRIDESLATWILPNSEEFLEKTTIIKVITVDGLLLGIVILLLGLLIIVIKFLKRLKNVEQIIEEEYSLEKTKFNAQKEGDENNRIPNKS